MAVTHRAAILPQKGSPLTISNRATPTPGPNKILIAVKAIAVNPVDYSQRDLGFPPVPRYPAVVGSDVAGLVVKVAENVTIAPRGSRVLALASSFYEDGDPDYGAFQEYVLASSECVTGLPDTMVFEEGAILPLAILTALSGWTTIGIPIGTRYSSLDRRAVLVWGGASSVCSLAVQSAKVMGFTVYATASARNHEYLEKLGADAVFDYKASDVVSQIVDTVKKDGVDLRTAYWAVGGSLQPTLDVLEKTKGDAIAKVAYAPPLLPGAPTLEGAEIRFVLPPMEPAERTAHMFKCFHVWLADGLKAGTVVPSPRIQVEAGGLGGLNKALDTLKAGVSGTKIVVQV
ncbi:putative zinc binding dehydrogenase [Delphinella strobiligena]|nr:putative zinc binding dehydrogenase [Delphinella strobiligena]